MRASFLVVLLSSAAAGLGLSPAPAIDVERIQSEAACDLVYCGFVHEAAPLPPAPKNEPAAATSSPQAALVVGQPPDLSIGQSSIGPVASAPRPSPPPPVVTVRTAPPVVCSSGQCRPRLFRGRFRN